MKSIESRITDLEDADGEWVIARHCNNCGELVIWSGTEGSCETHRPAPPPSPGDIVIRRSYGRTAMDVSE
jgi:hypothetical protein